MRREEEGDDRDVLVLVCSLPHISCVQTHLGWGTAGVSPVQLSDPPKEATTRITVRYGRTRGAGKLGPQGPSPLTGNPRGPRLHGWHSLPKCPGTFLRAGDERGRACAHRTLSVCVLRSVSWRYPTCNSLDGLNLDTGLEGA